MSRFFMTIAGLALLVIGAGAASAQIRPESSGQPSFDEPSMRRHGSGLKFPNEPPRHRRHRRHARYGMPFR